MGYHSKISRVTGIALGVIAAVTMGSSAADAQKTMNWRMQSNLSVGEPGYEAMREMVADKMAALSDGRLKITLHPTGALFPISQGLEAVGNGIVEIAMMAGGYFVGKMGPIAAFEMGIPGVERTALERYNFFYEKGFIDLVREAYAKHGIYYLAPNLTPRWDIMSRKPIRSMEDFQGLKIRSNGIEANWYQSMGAAPVHLSGGDIYTGLATGVIDAVRWGSPSVNVSLGLHEVAKYYIQPSPMPAANNNIVVNMRAWNSLPDDIKAMLDVAARTASLDYLARGEILDAAAAKKMTEAGVEFINISESSWAEMEAKAHAIMEEYANKDAFSARAVAMVKDYLAELGR